MKIRATVLDWLDDSQESAVDVIDVLVGTIYDIFQVYFGAAVTAKMFKDFAKTADKLSRT